MIARILSAVAYRRFMARSRRAEARATATREIGRIRAARRAVVHAALEAGR
jgi:hypothetical protein